jgi:Integrase core domain
MHRTLKKEATKPAAANVLQQQARLTPLSSIERYNAERPHQALGMKVPADCSSAHRPSTVAGEDLLPLVVVTN